MQGVWLLLATLNTDTSGGWSLALPRLLATASAAVSNLDVHSQADDTPGQAVSIEIMLMCVAPSAGLACDWLLLCPQALGTSWCRPRPAWWWGRWSKVEPDCLTSNSRCSSVKVATHDVGSHDVTTWRRLVSLLSHQEQNLTELLDQQSLWAFNVKRRRFE